MEPPALECDGVDLAYDGRRVVHGLTLDVAQGQSVVLLGPSGSGKSTILAAVAGFVDPTAGEIRLGGRIAASPTHGVPPERRRVGMVFQHYALWPHLTAVETVAYPMRRRRIKNAQARADALRLLERLGLAGLADRRPAQLSGGEQQRVGLARAIARAPDLFLFDEPTAHLDTPLRAALQEELAERRARSGTAALTATHDTTEALAMADRVALLRDGRLLQVGTPGEVYARPRDLWAARLTGPASVLEVQVVGPGVAAERSRVRIGEAVVAVDGLEASSASAQVRILVRPDWASLGGQLTGTVVGAWFRGPHTDYRLATAAGQVEIRESGPPRLAPGAAVGWRLDRAWALAAPEAEIG